jgi:hypothetical protein
MRIYTSYFSNSKKLTEENIEMISISRGKPKWFHGRSCDALAPTWAMLKMNDEDYWKNYEAILKRANPDDVVKWLKEGLKKGCNDVALLCWEKDINDCHRKRVAEWLNEYGYDVVEFNKNVVTQLSLFDYN